MSSWKPYEVFILGAGASVHAGAPVMSNFLFHAEDLFRGTDNFKKENIFELMNAIKGINTNSSTDLTNIENLLGLIEMGSIFGGIGIYDKHRIIELKKDFKRLIASTLEYKMKFKTNADPVTMYNWAPPTSYSKLSAKIKEKVDSGVKVAIISFNYDVGIDLCVANESIQYNYYIDKVEGESLPLLKLHGSLNWFKYKSNKKIHIIPVQNAITHSITQRLRDSQMHFQLRFQEIASELSISGLDIEKIPVIVPPTWSKTDYSGPILSVWEKAYEVLKQAIDITVIGYSFPQSDSFFRYLFALGTFGSANIRSFKVVDVDPKGGGVERRFLEILGPSLKNRYQYFDCGFEKYLDYLQ